MVETAVGPEMTHGFGPNLENEGTLTARRPSGYLQGTFAGWTATDSFRVRRHSGAIRQLAETPAPLPIRANSRPSSLSPDI